MSKITQFDKSNLPALRTEINEALKALGEKYGISLQAGNASFQSNNATFKLVCQVGEDKSIRDLKDDKAASALSLYQKMSFPDLRLDFNYQIGKDVFKITGYNTRGRTQPMLIENVKTGSKHKCGLELLRGAKAVAQ